MLKHGVGYNVEHKSLIYSNFCLFKCIDIWSMKVGSKLLSPSKNPSDWVNLLIL